MSGEAAAGAPVAVDPEPEKSPKGPEKSPKGKAPAQDPTAERDPRDPAASEPEREAAEQLKITEQLAGLGKSLAAGGGTYFANFLLGPVDASRATFGHDSGSKPDEVRRRTRTGRLPEEETSALCAHFAEPPGFRTAAEALGKDRAVVLTGARGLGKRTSAIRLLLDAGAKTLEIVSPMLTLEELSKHDFEAEHGYLVEDWQQSPGADGTGDYNWRLLHDHVNDSKVHLVITAAEGKTKPDGRAVTHFPWTAPTAGQVLAAHLNEPSGDLITEITAHIPDGYPVGSVAAIGRRLAQDGSSPETLQPILQELSAGPGRHVREWITASERSDEDIQRVTALCFAASRSERVFEVFLIGLEATLRDQGLLVEPETDQAVGLTIRRRRSMDLMERENGIVRFQGRDEEQQYLYHRHVVQELWREYDMNFWFAVRDWLDTLIGDATMPDVQVAVAVGLTMLAFTALEEVESSYLHPWASGEQAWPGQRTAVYVLSLMSRDDSLSPVALRIASNWVNSGDRACQWTAAAALSGELGLAYPAAATNRLWHLVGQWRDVPTEAILSLANLFATLTRERKGQEALEVLELLRMRMARASDRSGQDETGRAVPPVSWRDDKKNTERAMLCVIAVLAVHDPLTRQPSVTSFLSAWPEHQGMVAELWTVVLRNRPLRKRALVALLHAGQGFEFVSEDPEAAARSLGDALTAALPEAEHRQLSLDFKNIIARSQRPKSDTAATVRALLNAFERLRTPERSEE